MDNVFLSFEIYKTITDYVYYKGFDLGSSSVKVTFVERAIENSIGAAQEPLTEMSILSLKNGWNTDLFPNNIQKTTEAMLVFLKTGGLQGGGVNFDAKIRSNSTDIEDVFLAHIGGANTFARALLTADKIITSSAYSKLRTERYSSCDSGKGKEFKERKLDFKALYEIANENGELTLQSGKQELFENIINQYF